MCSFINCLSFSWIWNKVPCGKSDCYLIFKKANDAKHMGKSPQEQFTRHKIKLFVFSHVFYRKRRAHKIGHRTIWRDGQGSLSLFALTLSVVRDKGWSSFLLSLAFCTIQLFVIMVFSPLNKYDQSTGMILLNVFSIEVLLLQKNPSRVKIKRDERNCQNLAAKLIFPFA